MRWPPWGRLRELTERAEGQVAGAEEVLRRFERALRRLEEAVEEEDHESGQWTGGKA